MCTSQAGHQCFSFGICRTANAEAAKAEAEKLAEQMAGEREGLADLKAANARLEKHVQVANQCKHCIAVPGLSIWCTNDRPTGS